MDARTFLQGIGPDFVSFWDNWHALPRSGPVPSLSDYLDHADPKIQPYLVIMDYIPPHHMRVRLAGTAIVAVFGEITGWTENQVFDPVISKQVFQNGWIMASHPAGLCVKRTSKDSTGRKGESYGMALPVQTTPDIRTVVSYNRIPKFNWSAMGNERIQAITGFGEAQWLDIGAGVPLPPQDK